MEVRLYRGTHELGHQSQVLSGCVTYGKPADKITPRDWTAEQLARWGKRTDSRRILRVTYLSPRAGRKYRSRVPGVCCNYRIFVRSDGGTLPFTAFATKRAFREWLAAYGLRVERWGNRWPGCWRGIIDPANAGEMKPLTLVTTGWSQSA